MPLTLLLVPAIPALMAVFLAFAGARVKPVSGWLATAAVFAALCVGAKPALLALLGHSQHAVAWSFLHVNALHVDLAFRLDPLSAVMFFVVLGVGGLIHMFSIGYMTKDPDKVRYFAYLNMFITFMLLLILGDNLFVLFIGWEGVGLSSYCLIGFWYQRDAPRRAAIKAFITNRIGDLAFMLGLLTLAGMTGTASFAHITRLFGAAPGDMMYPDLQLLLADRVGILGYALPVPDMIALLLFIGACGKSAQFPLHVWLPDAMEGPTPVSALIHAATMVTAGIYMVVRLEPIFRHAPLAREIMLAVAVLTSLGAALAALAQTDLKRILAYSTISQLGFMMAGASVGGSGAAIFHLATHAIFKALLFLSAGSVMHALSGELNIRKMGGLTRRLPWTSTAMVVGALGLAGLPPFAGFFSKDAILVAVAHHHPVHALFLYATALVTAFYTARMVTVALLGESRLDHHAAAHCHEAAPIMILPLVLLAGGTCIAGWSLDISGILGEGHAEHNTLIVAASVIGPVVMLALGYRVYSRRLPEPSFWGDFAMSGFRLDGLYDRVFIRPLAAIARWVNNVLDGVGIDSTCKGLAQFCGFLCESARVFQTGRLGDYLSYVAIGLAAMIWFVFR